MLARKPLVGKLPENVLNDADAKLKEDFGALKASGERPATIEDQISYLADENQKGSESLICIDADIVYWRKFDVRSFLEL